MNEACPSPEGDRLGEACLSLYVWLERALHKTTSRACYGKTCLGGIALWTLTLSETGRDSLAGCFDGRVRIALTGRPCGGCLKSCLRCPWKKEHRAAEKMEVPSELKEK